MAKVLIDHHTSTGKVIDTWVLENGQTETLTDGVVTAASDPAHPFNQPKAVAPAAHEGHEDHDVVVHHADDERFAHAPIDPHTDVPVDPTKAHPLQPTPHSDTPDTHEAKAEVAKPEDKPDSHAKHDDKKGK